MKNTPEYFVSHKQTHNPLVSLAKHVAHKRSFCHLAQNKIIYGYITTKYKADKNSGTIIRVKIRSKQQHTTPDSAINSKLSAPDKPFIRTQCLLKSSLERLPQL